MLTTLKPRSSSLGPSFTESRDPQGLAGGGGRPCPGWISAGIPVFWGPVPGRASLVPERQAVRAYATDLLSRPAGRSMSGLSYPGGLWGSGAGQPWWTNLVWFPPLTPGRHARPRPALFRRDSVRSQYFRVPPPWGRTPSVPLGLEGLVGSRVHTAPRWTVSWRRSRAAVCPLCLGCLALRARVSGDAVTSGQQTCSLESLFPRAGVFTSRNNLVTEYLSVRTHFW